MTGKASVKDLVAEARQTVENLTVAQLQKELQRDGVVLVDLREPGERAEPGTIPGALAAPRGMLEYYADPATPYHKRSSTPRGVCCCTAPRAAAPPSGARR